MRISDWSSDVCSSDLLTLAFEQGFRFAAKPVTAEIVEQVLSRAIDDLEPTLTRNGYDAGALASQLNTRPSDIRAFLAGTLDAEHTRDLTERLREADRKSTRLNSSHYCAYRMTSYS